MLGQHLLERRHARLDVELLRGAGDRYHLSLGLTLCLQSFDHALRSETSELSVIGPDIGGEEFLVLLFSGVTISITGIPAALARVSAGIMAWSLTYTTAMRSNFCAIASSTCCDCTAAS